MIKTQKDRFRFCSPPTVYPLSFCLHSKSSRFSSGFITRMITPSGKALLNRCWQYSPGPLVYN